MSKTENMETWLERISNRDLPILNNTVKSLQNVTEDGKTSAQDLARVILRDPNMTSDVLKLANSVYYNGSGQEINTISRAVVVLGFDTVRTIGLSVALIDSLLKRGHRNQIVPLMRHAICAAVQAKGIAQARGDKLAEEVFIATLLSKLGHMAFWSAATDKEARTMNKALQAGFTPKEAEREVLGFTLDQLTVGLANSWNLGDILIESLGGKPKRSERSESIRLGSQLEDAIREHGKDSDEVKEVSQRIAEHAKLSEEKTKELIDDGELEVKKAARSFGISIERFRTEKADDIQAETTTTREPDEMLQLKILRELVALLKTNPSIPTVLDMILEGIYRGMAMDRTLFALMTPDRHGLMARYSLGDPDNELRAEFNVDLREPPNDLLRRVLADKQPFWAKHPPNAAYEALLTNKLKMRYGTDFFIGPMLVRGHLIGLLYADTATTRRPLTQELFNSFEHFVQQANISLEHITKK